MSGSRMCVVTVVCAALVAPMAVHAETAWNSLRAGTPVLPGYFADPCARKFGDTYYLYVTPDGWGVGQGPAGAWSSKDYVNWTFHPMNWPVTDFKWAPSVVEYKGKYYMYTQTPCMIWGAVADTPLGPWTSLSEPGKPMIPDATPKGSIVLDGECFIDDDGQIYMWYSTWWTPTMAKMKTDMRTIDGTPIQYFKNPHNPTPPKGIVQGCMEAPYMFKRKGTYYLMYSDAFCQNSTYNVKYSTSTSPTGPFTFDPSRNPILQTSDDGTVDGPGHHTILEDGGKVYIVYHRHDNPHDPDGAHRQTCIDELRFNDDGSIEKVEPGHMGVGYLAPSTKRDTNIALGKPAKASSHFSSFFVPAYAVDENNGTLWKAGSRAVPQWLEVDLGAVSAFKRIETEFQYPQIVHSYVIETSVDGTAWKMFADRRSNTTCGIMTDKGDARARHVRITMYGGNSGREDQFAALWALKVYDGVDKPNQAPKVDAGQCRTLSSRFPTFVLDAAVWDDGLPNGPVKVAWSQVSGPDTAVFAHPDRCRTSVMLGRPGTYVLKLTADDGARKGEGTVTLTLVPPSDRILHYTFDEDYGWLVNDTTENNRPGVLRNNVERCLGPRGGAVNFESRDGFVAVPPLGALSNLTVAAWINVHTLRPEASAILCSDGTTNGDLRFVVEGGGELGIVIGGRQPAVSAFRFPTNALGTWHHVAVTFDSAATSAAFFIDGMLDTTRPMASGTLNLGGNLRMGSADAGACGLDGELDDVRVFDRVLTASEIGVFAAKTSFISIADAQKLADGDVVTLMAKVVTFAPMDPLSFERASDYFYIAEPDGSAGIRVQDCPGSRDRVVADNCASLVGVMKTAPSRERYVELLGQPGNGAPRKAVVRKTTVGKVLAAPRAEAAVVKLAGKVKEIAQDKMSFVLTGEGSEVIKVNAASPKQVRGIAAGTTVELSGVVGLDASAGTRVIMLMEFRRTNPPPAPGLAFYSFEEQDGDVAKDSSGNGNDATLVNNVLHVQGTRGKAVKFDGEKSFMALPDMGVQPTVTIAAWINLAGPGADLFGSSILHGDGWTWGDMHAFVVNDSSNLVVCVNGGADIRSTSKFYPDLIGKWVHVAIVYDSIGHVMQLYLNGKCEASRAMGPARPMDLTSTKVGSWGDRGRMFKGMMDEFMLYDRALSAEEIAALYQGKAPQRAR